MATAAFKAVMPVENRRIGSTPIHSRNTYDPMIAIKTLIEMIKKVWTLSLVLIIGSCSTGSHVRNILNAPIDIMRISSLDSVSVKPDVARYNGPGETVYHEFSRDIRLQGNHEQRPIWTGTEQGAFRVQDGATVHILDFNFTGGGGSDTLMSVEAGTLILENCDIYDLKGLGIFIAPEAMLEVRNTRFTRIGGVGIRSEGRYVRLWNSAFDMCGPSSLNIESAQIFEAHKVQIASTMGSGLQLNGCSEVWLDSVQVTDSFEDGMFIENSDFVLLENSRSNENGKNGLTLHNSVLSGLIGFSAVGNLVNGLSAESIDSLRLTHTEFVANGKHGAELRSIQNSTMVNVVAGHNGLDGVSLSQGRFSSIHHSTFQANLQTALKVNDLGEFNLLSSQLHKNTNGVAVETCDTVRIATSAISASPETGILVSGGTSLDISSTKFMGNGKGLRIEDLKTIRLHANLFQQQEQGVDIRVSQFMNSTSNEWVDNQSGLFLSEIEMVQSQNDKWLDHQELALEAIAIRDLLLTGSVVRGNRQGILLNQTSSKLEECQVDSTAGFGLKALNSSINLLASDLNGNVTAVELGEGSHGKITQTRFDDNLLALLTGASSDLTLSFSTVRGGHTGVLLDDFSDAQIISNRVESNSEQFLDLRGSTIRSLYLRQNVVTGSGRVMRSKSRSGDIALVNNTFADNETLMIMPERTIDDLEHNIFHRSGSLDPKWMKNLSDIQWNCFSGDTTLAANETLRASNLFVDPQLDENYYLTSPSPCVDGGRNGLQIGALGISSPSRPTLSP